MAWRIFSCNMWTLSCNMWDLVPWPGIKLPALGVRSLSHWTTREVPLLHFWVVSSSPVIGAQEVKMQTTEHYFRVWKWWLEAVTHCMDVSAGRPVLPLDSGQLRESSKGGTVWEANQGIWRGIQDLIWHRCVVHTLKYDEMICELFLMYHNFIWCPRTFKICHP